MQWMFVANIGQARCVVSSIEQQAGGSAPLRFKVTPGAIWLCVRAAGPVVARWLPLGLRATKWLAASPADWSGWLFHWACIAFGIPFCYMVATAVLTPQLFIPPIDAPQSLVKRGYSAPFLAQRITSSMDEIGRQATVSIPHEVITGNDEQPEIQVPGQELSYTSTVYFLKKVVKRPDVAVHVGITEEGDSYVAHVQVEGGAFHNRQGTVKAASRDDIDTFIRDIGTEAMRLAEPIMLASYLFSSVEKGGCDRDKCDFRQVESIYDDVLRLPVPEQAEWALAGKGLILLTKGYWKSAEEQSRQALAMHAHSAVLRANLAVALEQQQKHDEALKEYRASATSKSRTAETLRLWGDALLHANRPDEALKRFAEAARMRPDFTDNLHDWGEALVQLGRYDEAIEKLSRAAALNPELAPSYIEWGRALEGKGDLRGAAYKYAQAADLDPHNQSARDSLAAVRAKEAGDAGKATVRARPAPLPQEGIISVSAVSADLE